MSEKQQKVPHALIVKTLRDNPTMTERAIAKHLGVSLTTISRVNRAHDVRKRRDRRLDGITSKGMVGRLMRELAERYDVEALARKTGLAPSTIVRLRGRPINPTFFAVEVLAQAAGYSLELVPKQDRPSSRN